MTKITENNQIEVSERLEFLAKQFDTFDCSEESLKIKVNELKKEGYQDIKIIKTVDGKIIGLKSSVKTSVFGVDPALKKPKLHKTEYDFSFKTSICIDVFTDMVDADPTDNKMYLQWMLNTFNRLLKGNYYITENGSYAYNDTTQEAIRFASEDLPQAKAYLTVFEKNKRKKKFKELSSKNNSLKNIKDYTDINQYKSLSQLFDAVDPFIERDSTEMESLLQRFVSLGEAEIPVRDRKFTVYIPLTRAASVIFEKYANWCTARAENSNFTSYTENHKKPNGKNSTLYIIINNKFFEGKSDEIYQIHFETDQLKNKQNTSENVSIYNDVIKNSKAISDYFYNELLIMAKECRQGVENNRYLDYLLKFGFAESLFEIFDELTPSICVQNENNKREIPKLPDMSKFVNLYDLTLINTKLTELPPSIGTLSNLRMISIPNNKLTSLPKELGNLKKLEFLNFSGNQISEIPNELTYLDKSNGGSLYMISLNPNNLTEEANKKLKKLLPNVEFVEK